MSVLDLVLRITVVIAGVALPPMSVFGAPADSDPVKTGLRQCQARDFGRSVKSLSAAVKIKPNDPALWTCLAESNAAIGRPELAVQDYKKSLALNADDPLGWFELGSIYVTLHADQKAITSYRKGLALDPMNQMANRIYALLLFENGQFQEALRWLRAALAGEPDNKKVASALIVSLLKTKKTVEADQQIRQFASTSSVEERTELTRDLLKEMQFQRAFPILEELVKTDPTFAEAHAQLGLLFLEEQHYEDSVWEIGQAVQLEPASSKYSLELSEALLRWHHYSTALDFLNSASSRFGDLVGFQYDLAYAHYGMRQYESSISIVKKLLEHHPGNAAAEFLLGNCYTAVGNYPAAEKHLAEAIRVEPSKPAYYLVMAQVARYQGKTEESERSIRRGLAIDPQDSSLLLESASCRESAGDLKGAAEVLERLVTKDPASIQAHRLLARIYWRLGKKAEAREEGKYASLEAQSEFVEPSQRNREK